MLGRGPVSRDVSPHGAVWAWQERKVFQEVGWLWVGVKGIEGQDQGSDFILWALESVWVWARQTQAWGKRSRSSRYRHQGEGGPVVPKGYWDSHAHPCLSV